MAQPSLGSRTPRQRIKGEVTLCIGGEAKSSARAGMCISSGTQTGERCPPASCGHGAPPAVGTGLRSAVCCVQGENALPGFKTRGSGCKASHQW